MSEHDFSSLPYFLVIAFLLFLYLPHIFFKLGAAKWLDLGRKKDSGQIEEFLSAAVPSTLLNVGATLFLFLPKSVFLYFLDAKRVLTAWPQLPVDWPLVGRIITGDSNEALRQYISRGAWWGEFGYLLWLYAVSAFNGRMYGRIVHARIVRRASGPHFTLEIFRKMSPWGATRWLIGGAFFKAWDVFYHDFHVPMFSWLTLSVFVWLRTVDNRIYFGSFVRYDKTPTGEVAGVTLSDVFRYKHDLPLPKLTKFIGHLYFPTERVADINITTAESFKRLRQRLDGRISPY